MSFLHSKKPDVKPDHKSSQIPPDQSRPESPCEGSALPPRSPKNKTRWWNSRLGIWMYPILQNNENEVIPLSPKTKAELSEFEVECKANEEKGIPNTFTISRLNAKDFKQTIASILTEICDNNTVPFTEIKKISQFHATSIPPITIAEYLDRFFFSGPTLASALLALIYIDKLIQLNPPLVLDYYCVHRLFMTSFVLASKFLDEALTNKYYAHCGGIDNRELNTLEVDLLSGLECSLYVSPDFYAEYFNTFMKRHSSVQPQNNATAGKRIVPY